MKRPPVPVIPPFIETAPLHVLRACGWGGMAIAGAAALGWSGLGPWQTFVAALFLVSAPMTLVSHILLSRLRKANLRFAATAFANDINESRRAHGRRLGRTVRVSLFLTIPLCLSYLVLWEFERCASSERTTCLAPIVLDSGPLTLVRVASFIMVCATLGAFLARHSYEAESDRYEETMAEGERYRRETPPWERRPGPEMPMPQV